MKFKAMKGGFPVPVAPVPPASIVPEAEPVEPDVKDATSVECVWPPLLPEVVEPMSVEWV